MLMIQLKCKHYCSLEDNYKCRNVNGAAMQAQEITI